MLKLRSLRLSLVLALPLCAGLLAPPAFAVNKDMIQLQIQIQQLQDAVARLQQANDERMGVLKDLVQQSADSVNKMSLTMDALSRQMAAQQQAEGGKVDQVSGQVQALNDTLDEIKARMARLEKAMADVQGQQQSIAAAMQNLPAGSGAPASTGAVPAVTSPAGTPSTTPSTMDPQASSPARSQFPANAPSNMDALNSTPAPLAAASRRIPRTAPAVASAPPVSDLYKAAFSDYMAAKYSVASSEFGDVIKSYPDDNLAGNSYYYMGEIDYRAGKYAAAARDYDKVLEQYPDNNKVPAAHLHKGQALIELRQTEAGIRELRSLIQRFPNSPEATQARSRLNGMGVPVRPRS